MANDDAAASTTDEAPEAAPPEPNRVRTHMRLRDRLRHTPRLGGVLMATLFYWESLRPTLLPRAWPIQALLIGACTAIGYAVGASISVIIGYTRNQLGKPRLNTRFGWKIAAFAAPVVFIAGFIMWPIWQNGQRDLVEMPNVSPLWYLPAVLAGAVLCIVLIAVGRLAGQGVVAIHRWLTRIMPSLVAFALTIAMFFLVAAVISQDVVFKQFVNWANNAYSTVDDTTPAGVTQPTSTDVSGGPESLVPWDTLGMQGRAFAGGAPSPADLQPLVKPGTQVMQPVRVYVGLQSADTAAARAQLAVEELERTGAFERRVLVVATVTGTGWINPRSALAVEALNGGTTAIVGIQYSYLPSWISFLVDTKKAAEAGRALFDAVHAKWETLPAGSRPELIVFGESLGSFGSESTFAKPDVDDSVANVVANTTNALWVGPTYSNPIRTPLVLDRNVGTPAWRPEIGDGRTVAFENGPDELLTVDGQHIVYQQHPSDPVGWWNWQTAYERPVWLQGERGYDVPDAAGWFPIVTWGQVSCDLIAGFSAPPGYGHNYDNAWPQAWAAVAAPPGWTDADTEALADRLAGYPYIRS